MPAPADLQDRTEFAKLDRRRATRQRRIAIAASLVLVCAAPVSVDAGARDSADPDDAYVRGVFSPQFIPPAVGTYELPVIRRVPPFVLLEAGRPVSTQVLTAGKIAVMSFIYTACSDRLGCPLATRAMSELQTRLLEGGLQERVVLLSISLDPGRDTPTHLATYARHFKANRLLWHFLTAPSEGDLRRMLAAYGQDREPIADERGRFTGRFRHVLKVFVLDAAARIRNIYSSGFLVPQVVVNDIKTLLTSDATGMK